MDSADIVRRLRLAGWEYVSTRGSHHKYRNPRMGKCVVVPHPKRDLPIGTARAILKQAELK
jgi:predicted RNA binding protein YcfA (HicA-like mRNA interferase family)